MIDLHAHILPGLDDGAQSLEESLEMAHMAAESGVTDLVATPHSNQRGRFENDDPQQLEKELEFFREALRAEHIGLRVHLGMEIFSSSDWWERIEDGKLIPLAGSRYYLVEFSFEEQPEIVTDRVEQLLQHKIVPVIAHPERYYCVQESPELVYQWVRMGCRTQINKGSVMGRFGRDAKDTAHELMRCDLATCMATDAHSAQHRTTYLRDAYRKVAKYHGEKTAHSLLVERPKKILENRVIRPHGKSPERKRAFFF